LHSASWKQSVPSEAKPETQPDLECRPAHRLERLVQRELKADRGPKPHGQQREQRLVLGVLLAPERATGVWRVNPDFRQGQVEQAGDHLLQHEGCWTALQTMTPSWSGAARKQCGSMAKCVTIGKV